MAPCYPITQVIQYRSKLHPPLAISNDLWSLDALRKQPLENDTYLTNVMTCLNDYYHKVTVQIPIKFEGIFVQVITITCQMSVQKAPFPVRKEQQPLLPSPVVVGHPERNIGDVLIILSDIVLHANKLIEKVNEGLSTDGQLSKKMQDLREFRLKLIDLSFMVDKILQFYKYKSSSLPSIESLKEAKKAALNLLKTKKKEFIEKYFGDGVNFSNEELVLAALGLNSATAKQLSDIEKDLRCHQTDLYFLKDIICKQVQENSAGIDEIDQVIDVLTKSGFTDGRARLLQEFIKENNLLEHQSLEYWIETYLDHMFHYDIFLNKDCPLFPHEAEKLNDWFKLKTKLISEDEDEEDENYLDVFCINTLKHDTHSLHNDKIGIHLQELQEGVWYHATDHESAENIRINGVDLSCGRKKQDFSHGKGFYLTPHYNFALEWATTKGSKSRCAVVVFKHNINASKYRGMDLRDNDELWSQIVKYNRSGRDQRYLGDINVPKIRKLLKGVDFIDGHMSGDQTKCDSPTWQPSKKAGDESVQLCILSEGLADEFSSCIKAIIFFCESTNNQQIQTF